MLLVVENMDIGVVDIMVVFQVVVKHSMIDYNFQMKLLLDLVQE